MRYLLSTLALLLSSSAAPAHDVDVPHAHTEDAGVLVATLLTIAALTAIGGVGYALQRARR